MLAQFDNGSTAFRQIMLGATGGAVCAIIVGMGSFMIIRSTRKMKRLREENLKT